MRRGGGVPLEGRRQVRNVLRNWVLSRQLGNLPNHPRPLLPTAQADLPPLLSCLWLQHSYSYTSEIASSQYEASGKASCNTTRCIPTVQPLWVVQPDAVCEVRASTPDLSYGDLGIFLGGGQTEKFVH